MVLRMMHGRANEVEAIAPGDGAEYGKVELAGAGERLRSISQMLREVCTPPPKADISLAISTGQIMC